MLFRPCVNEIMRYSDQPVNISYDKFSDKL